MYTRSVFRPSSTPFLPLFLPLSGDHTIHSFGGDRLPFKISGNTHRALDTTTSTRRRGHHSMASSIMGSPLLSLFVVATRFRASAASSSSRDGRWTGGAIDSDRALSLCIFSLFHSRSLVTTSLVGVAFSRKCTQNTIEKREREKAYLSDGAVLELAGDSRELRELSGLRREMRVRLRVERSDRRLSRTNAVRGTFCEKRLLHTFSSSNNTQMRIEHPKKKEKKKKHRA